MSGLTLEERQRIYLEEKARLEVCRELEGKKTSAGKVIGLIAPCGIGLLAVLFIIGSLAESSDDGAWKILRPIKGTPKP